MYGSIMFVCLFIFFLDVFSVVLCVRVICLHLCLCIVGKPGACGGQEKGSDLPELELRMIVSFCVGTGNRTLVLCKCSKFS